MEGFATGTWHYLGVIRASGTWSGGGVAGSPQDAGLYVYVGDIGQAYLPVVARGYLR